MIDDCRMGSVSRRIIGPVAAMLLILVMAMPAFALTLARPFGDHMVLPMGRPVPVWGTAGANEKVTVTFGGKTAMATADGKGVWRALLPPFPPSSDGREMVVEAGGRITLKDVLVGRVWLCSGQSNMDFPLARATGGMEEAKTAGQSPSIRLCDLTGAPTDGRVYDAAALARLNPQDHFTGSWARASAESAAGFSAIAWWAGKAIHAEIGVPVGLVENAVGGSGTEAWLPQEMLAARRDYRELLGEEWLESEKMSAWARGRAKRNLGAHPASNHPFRPGFLFESGLRDLAGFPFYGVLWYQGETNAEIDDTAWNERLITDLVLGWRKVLGNDDLPFFMIQLPRIGGNDPLRKQWPAYRKAQAAAAGRLAGVSLIVTEDLGYDSPDVHPPDKRPVAMRLAEAVLESARDRRGGLGIRPPAGR